MKCWILVSISSTVSLPYLVMNFFGVPEESAIMMIFAPVYIEQVDGFVFYIKELWDLNDGTVG